MRPAIRASEISRIIEEAWSALRRRIPDLPEVVVVVAAPRPHRGTIRTGHFSPARWSARGKPGETSELGIHPALFHLPQQVLETLLHEAAHGILWSRGVDSVHDYYHLKSFRAVCEKELHLRCKFRNTRYGWTSTSLTPEAIAWCQDVIEILEGLQWQRGRFEGGTAPTKNLPRPGYLTLCCNCKPARKIRCTPRNLERGTIRCSVCESDFRAW